MIHLFGLNHKVKAKVSSVSKHCTMKADWGCEGKAAPLLDVCTWWRWIICSAFHILYPWGKSLLYPLDKRLGEAQSQSGCDGIEKDPCSCRELDAIVVDVHFTLSEH